MYGLIIAIYANQLQLNCKINAISLNVTSFPIVNLKLDTE